MQDSGTHLLPRGGCLSTITGTAMRKEAGQPVLIARRPCSVMGACKSAGVQPTILFVLAGFQHCRCADRRRIAAYRQAGGNNLNGRACGLPFKWRRALESAHVLTEDRAL